jgi:hypothetical protein
MTNMADADNVQGSESLFIGLVGRDAKGKYLKKDFGGKMTSRAQWTW